MCCYVAMSDLTSIVEERCHGGQTYWDVCLWQVKARNFALLPTVRILLWLS